MDDVLAFRNAMAELGYEYTPAQADKAMKATEDFRQKIHDGCRENPEQYENLVDLTPEDKQAICRQFVEDGQEITLEELDGLVYLVMEVYEEEKMF